MKQLSSEDYITTPFVTHKQQSLTHTFLSGSTARVWIDLASKPASTWSFSTDEPVNPTGIYKRSLYKSINSLFYASESLWNSGPMLDKKFSPTGSDIYVISISQNAFGEGIRPGTFEITTPSSTQSLYDDGYGRLISDDDTTIPVGNVFYSVGVAVVQKSPTTGSLTGSVILPSGFVLTTGSILNVNFEATHTIYEHQILCQMDRYEYNYSTNPTVSGSVVTGSVKVTDAFASESLTPYFTTVGLYNDMGEMVAVAKFPKPLKRAVGSQQTIIIRLDF